MTSFYLFVFNNSRKIWCQRELEEKGRILILPFSAVLPKKLEEGGNAELKFYCYWPYAHSPSLNLRFYQSSLLIETISTILFAINNFICSFALQGVGE